MLQHATHLNRYLRVSTYGASWLISDDSKETQDGFIESASAGGVCAADPSNARCESLGLAGWEYVAADGEWREGGIKVTCKSHAFE